MNRSLVTTKHIRPPKELEPLFDDPPLVGRERREEYDAFFSVIARAEMPSDAIDWILLKDFVDLDWEIRRERRIKVEIIKLNQTEVKLAKLERYERRAFSRRNRALREI